MCGLAGFWRTPDWTRQELSDVTERMTAEIVHRGPDDSGVWVDPRFGIALGFRRLSIVDLTATGHQPMQSAEGRFTIIFNGEIYNFRELRAQLRHAGHSFRGSADTEVILAACAEWGIAGAIPRLAGMFAMAIWDATSATLTLVRDRVGKKPLYFGRINGTWLFASELKALRAYPQWEPQLDPRAVAGLLRFSYVPAPLSIYQGIGKLLPGHMLTVGRDSGEARPQPFWDAETIAVRGQSAHLTLSDDEAIGEAERRVTEAVTRRLVCDVPMGAFLSGGIDSSLIVALMQRSSGTPVKTFTIGFASVAFDESASAREISSYLGTDHTELRVTPDDAVAVIERLPRMFDEPFADSSQIPTFLLSQMARRAVTVCISGDGGDELMGGYNRHVWAPRLWRRLALLPQTARNVMASGILSVPAGRLDALYRGIDWALPERWHVRLPADKLQKLAGILDAKSPDDVYARLVSSWQVPPVAQAVCDVRTSATGSALAFTERMMLRDQTTYLPDDILVKVDRASMAASLEVRSPLLDHELIEWAWQLPAHMRMRDGQGKWLLRQLLYRHVPKSLVERPKMGFGIPVGEWLRSRLRGWAEELLTTAALEESGLDARAVRRVWADHLAGIQDNQARLWPVLMLQSWRRAWRM
jgi:asparagine synthase (glutamine-hydrolysing)